MPQAWCFLSILLPEKVQGIFQYTSCTYTVHVRTYLWHCKIPQHLVYHHRAWCFFPHSVTQMEKVQGVLRSTSRTVYIWSKGMLFSPYPVTPMKSPRDHTHTYLLWVRIHITCHTDMIMFVCIRSFDLIWILKCLFMLTHGYTCGTEWKSRLYSLNSKGKAL